MDGSWSVAHDCRSVWGNRVKGWCSKRCSHFAASYLFLTIRDIASALERTRRASSAMAAPLYMAFAMAKMAVCCPLCSSRQLVTCTVLVPSHRRRGGGNKRARVQRQSRSETIFLANRTSGDSQYLVEAWHGLVAKAVLIIFEFQKKKLLLLLDVTPAFPYEVVESVGYWFRGGQQGS